MCDNKELLIAYLYDDVTAEERRTFDAHLAVCGECREELTALRATRGQLSLWAPPEPDFAFRIIREPAATSANVLPFRSRWMPALGLAAAAVLVLAAATAIANLEIRYDTDGLVVRTGWARGEAAVAQLTPSPSDATRADASLRSQFEVLNRRLNELERVAVSQPASATVQMAGGPRMSDAEMLRRVRQIVDEAESRQQVAVAQRLLQVMQDFERQRRADFAMLQEGTAHYQDITNAKLAQTSDIVNQLMRVATRQEK